MPHGGRQLNAVRQSMSAPLPAIRQKRLLQPDLRPLVGRKQELRFFGLENGCNLYASRLTIGRPPLNVQYKFEITGDDILHLNDEDLRALIGRLCEAELRRQGHSVSHVTWGGSQTAKDGGLDVHVALPTGAAIEGFIPKPETGFQVKKPDMPRKEIIDEMKPGGVIRPVILELAKASGAYIIVSSTGSTADSALNSRKEAMAEALKELPTRQTHARLLRPQPHRNMGPRSSRPHSVGSLACRQINSGMAVHRLVVMRPGWCG